MASKEEETVDALRARYEAAGQDHVFAHWDKCDEGERAALAAQLRSVDLDHVKKIFDRSVADHDAGAAAKGDIEPVVADASVLDASAEDLHEWREAGLGVASLGELAVVLLAGGQGTRLGSSAPKGMYDIGLPSGRTLFRLQAERLAKLMAMSSEEANQGAPVRVPWYIMTSPHTNAATEKYFQENEYFGLDKADVTFFQQGSLPCFTPEGKIIMESRSTMATAPEGNGGIYAALHASGVIDDMRLRGVKHVYAYCVDNALVKVGDPTYVGFCALRNVEAGAKVIAKAYPEEAVGVFTRRNGEVHVVEYSEMPAELASATDPESGKIKFDAANVVLHYYSFDFLKRCCAPGDVVQSSLVYHVAKKKVPRVTADGCGTETPETPNGVKLEAFIFDVYKYAKDVAFLEGDRAADFAPVKNKEGTGKDSPDTARALIDALHREWIMNADGSVDEDDDDGLGVTHPDGKRYVEVAPAASYAGEYLEPIVKSYFMGFVPAGASIEPLKKEGTTKRSAEDPAQGDEPPAKK